MFTIPGIRVHDALEWMFTFGWNLRSRCPGIRSFGTGRGIEPSVGSRGDSYDNALAESIIGLYKTEVIHRREPWRGPEDVEFTTLEWVHWYNTQRPLLGPIGNVSPVEYEMNYYRSQEGSLEMARLN